MDLIAIRLRLAETVRNNATTPPGVTLYVYPTLPRHPLSQFPAFYLVPSRIAYNRVSADGKNDLEINGLLFAGPASKDLERSQELLDYLIAPPEGDSLHTVIQADRTGGDPPLWSGMHCNELEEYGYLESARQVYVGARYPITLHMFGS